jgi:hypothetical protein
VFFPWPGETLSLALHQPPPIDGALLTVDSAALRLQGRRLGDRGALSMTVRAATVTTRTVTLPAGAHLGSVKIAGAEVPMAKDATELRLPLQPGLSEVNIEWKQDDGVQAVYARRRSRSAAPRSTLRVAIDFVDDTDRVILWTGGGADGPIVWLWPWFGALALLAWSLGGPRRAAAALEVARPRPRLRRRVHPADRRVVPPRRLAAALVRRVTATTATTRCNPASCCSPPSWSW